MTRRIFIYLHHPKLRLTGVELGGDNVICPGLFADLTKEDPSAAGLIVSRCGNYDDDKCRQCWDKQIPDETWTLKRALDTYGAEAQTLMVFEEMAELQKELCKHARGADNRENIAEEIADVFIMLDQMMMLHDCAGAVAEYRHRKITRLADRLKEERR